MKKNIHVLLIVLGMTIVSLKCYSQDPNFHIYLCFGQSNMEGTGTIEAQDRITNPRVKVFQDQSCSNLNRTYGNWYTAAPPLNRCWGGLGIADYFGKTMADATPANITIGLIPASVGGCDIAFFQKGAPLGKASVNGGTAADIPPQFTGGYEWIIDMVTKAQKVGVIKGIIFHQGETNTGDPNWKYKVQGIVNNLRTDLGLGNVPFLTGELLYGQYGSCCSSHNAEVNKIPSVITNSYVISASGLPGKDVAHFTSASYRTYGWRYAQQMLALENNGCIPTTIDSYVQSDGINWVQQSNVQACVGSDIKLGPHPTTNSGWSWTGPGNFTAATREVSLTNLTTAQGGVYTASYTNEDGCVSKSQITVTVNALPVLSNHIQVNGGTWDPLDNISVCAGSNIGSGPWPLSTTGWTWIGPNGFVSATREFQFTNVTPNQSGLYKSTYTDANGCRASLNFSVTINEIPSLPTVSTPVSYCQNTTAIPLGATGGGLKWYTSITGGTALANAPIPSTINVGTTNYYVSQTTNGCESPRAMISATVNALPIATISTTTPTTFCSGGSVLLTSSAGSSYKWINGAIQVGTAQTYTATTSGAYAVEITNSNNCKATSIPTTITGNNTPTSPTVTSPVTYCQNVPATALAAIGAGLKWYTTATGGTALAGAPTPVTTTIGKINYYVSQITNGCESGRAQIIVTVNALPTAAIIASSATTFCSGGSVTLTSGNATSYLWKNGNTQVGTSANYTATTAGNYTVEVTNATGCKATSAITAISVTTGTTWYADTDGDGKGDAALIQTACAKPAGYVSVAGDLCPADANKLSPGDCGCGNAETDSDKDGDADCIDTDDDNDGIADATDCSPLNVSVGAASTWYADADGDGKGDGSITQISCSKPSGYVSIAGDLCPADANKIAAGDCGCGNTELSCRDCAGVANGTASLDVCNICSGGTTGIIAITDVSACTTTGVVDLTANDAIKILPNPSSSEFTLLLTNTSDIQVLSADGKLVEVFNEVNNLNFGGTYAKGVYILQINNGRTIQVLRVIKL